MKQSVGEKLRKARLEKGLSFDEVYKQTRIYPRVLEGLEQDRAHNFLSLLYIKGFLRSYARYLGLDGEILLREYMDSQELEKDQPAPASIEKKGKPPSRPIRINPILMFRAAAVVIVAFALILCFRFALRRISRPVSIQQTEEKKVKVRVMPAAPAKKVKVEEELVLEVRTKDACWMQVTVDNQAIFEKTMPKGKKERWRAKERIELRIGKPEVLEVFVNGKRIDLKKVKVKRTLFITHEGVKGK